MANEFVDDGAGVFVATGEIQRHGCARGVVGVEEHLVYSDHSHSVSL